MTHTTHPIWKILLALGLLAQAHAALAAISMAGRPDNTSTVIGGRSEPLGLATPVATDGTTPQIKKSATHFSSGALQLRQQVMEQRKASAGQ
jgi:hypothetical protein